ncbi:hypothetical protein GGR08_000507 [Bartonella fuyuanensis]|uniref:Uncharacterized protein n=1 Tax=Bartonella fuyuanensis TaxID=1460968 RepID=A0A840DT17_9HYPH|nr:hypothetical protein [Bartonella fuyuanensis]
MSSIDNWSIIAVENACGDEDKLEKKTTAKCH